MAITAAVCDSFKTQLLQGVHDFTVLTGTNTVSSVAAAGGTAGPGATATTVYTGTFTNGGNGAYAGLIFTLTGFGTAANNGTFLCIASTTTTITLCNIAGANSGAMGTVSVVRGSFMLALYTSSATMDKTTTTYSATNEVANSGTYAAGGIALVSTTPVLSTDTACCLFNTVSWTSFTAASIAGALIYDNTYPVSGTGGKPACLVFSFGAGFAVTAGTFTVNFPAQTAGNAVLGLA